MKLTSAHVVPQYFSKILFHDLYFCTVHVVTFTLFKTNSCIPFKHTFTSTFYNTKIVKKCFVKTSLNPTCFGHYCMTILRGRLSYLVHYQFSACFLRPVVYSVCGCMLCVCVRACVRARCTCLWDVWSRLVHDQTSHRQVHRARTHARTHTHRQHTATYRISNWTKQTS
jgi:hypothetical protein